MTPAQVAQQHNRDGAGRYTEKTATDPGTSALPACDRFTPPTIGVHFEDLSDGRPCSGEDVLQMADGVDTAGLERQISAVFPHMPAGKVQLFAQELVKYHLVAQWMDTEGGAAAEAAFDFDTTHPGEPALLRGDLDDYIVEYDPENGDYEYDWAQAAEDTAAATRLFITTVWRREEANDRRLTSDTGLTREPAA